MKPKGGGDMRGLGERPLEDGQQIERFRFCVRSDDSGGFLANVESFGRDPGRRLG